jgi:hypothetical protein
LSSATPIVAGGELGGAARAVRAMPGDGATSSACRQSSSPSRAAAGVVPGGLRQAFEMDRHLFAIRAMIRRRYRNRRRAGDSRTAIVDRAHRARNRFHSESRSVTWTTRPFRLVVQRTFLEDLHHPNIVRRNLCDQFPESGVAGDHNEMAQQRSADALPLVFVDYAKATSAVPGCTTT